MQWCLIDAIGPFFWGLNQRRINWSKIPFAHLATEGEERRRQWGKIRADLRHFAQEVSRLGYDTVTLDDVAHLTPHPLHEPEIAAKIAVFREEFDALLRILHEHGLRIFLTSDVIPLTPALERAFGGAPTRLASYFRELISRCLDDFPLVSGVILRIGEADGTDVLDPIRTSLHLRSSKATNSFLRELLPLFEQRGKTLIFRTWTVGAHQIGDLIWHRDTLAETLEGIDSPNFIVSMKHGESDFFRYLPLNRAFFRIPHPKIIELQARKEYEGAGEFPSFLGWDVEHFARELANAPNVVGMSVWCQTGGWHAFRRLAFLEDDGSDIWIQLNAIAAIRVLRDNQPVEQAVLELIEPDQATATLELLRHSETMIHELLYIEDFARQKLFFRRVRIPPLLHAYWDCLFFNSAVRKVMRHFVRDPERALRAGEAAFALFPRMIDLARQTSLPVEDIIFMRDTFELILLARRYYFLPFEQALVEEIREKKKAYKQRWPRSIRQRYRIKTSFEPFKIKRRTLGWATRLLLRRQRGYRMIDRVFTLHLLGFLYRMFKPRARQSMPKFLRKSAMGVDTLFR